MKKIRPFLGGVIFAGCLAVFFLIFYHQYQRQINKRALALYQEGKSLAGSGRNNEAIKALKESVTLNPRIGNPHLMLGVVYDSENDLEGAEKEWRGALGLKMEKVNEAIAHHNLGLIYLKQPGALDRAMAEFRLAIQTDPDFFAPNSDPHVGLARCYGLKKWYDEAVYEARQSIKINPKSGKGYFYLGVAYLSKNDILSAEKIYEDLRIIHGELAEKLMRAIRIASKKRNGGGREKTALDELIGSSREGADAGELSLWLTATLKKEGLTLIDFENATNHYYQDPQPERLIRVLKAVLSEERLVRQSISFDPLAHFFATVASRDKIFLKDLIGLGEEYSGFQKEVILRIINQAENFFSPYPKSATDVDYLWAEFSATGEKEPIRKIAGLLIPSETNKESELLSKVAEWSLTANAEEHGRVYEILREESASATGKLKERLVSILK